MDPGPSAKRPFPSDVQDTRGVQLLARFMNSQGLPYDAVNEGPLQELIRHLKPNFQFPLPKQLEEHMDGVTSKASYKVRDISVTMGVARSANQTFAVYSAHLLLNLRMKKSSVFMRRLEKGFGEDANELLEFVRYEVQKNPQFWEANVKNIVVPDQKTYDALHVNPGQYRFLCFNYLMKEFAEQVLSIPEFVLAVEELREFIETVRADSLLMKHFKKLQLSNKASQHLPTFGDGSWHSTAHFLAKSIEMYPTFTQLLNTMSWHSQEEPSFIMPVFHVTNPNPQALFQLLQECVKFSRENSNQSSSVSQVLPSLMLLKRFIVTKWAEHVGKQLVARALTILRGILEKLLAGEAGLQYEMAMLLDPRFGYRADLYSTDEWSMMEGRVGEELVRITGSPSNLIITHLQDYRFLCLGSTVPHGNENPLQWWIHHQRGIISITTVAREMYSVPATAVDVEYFYEKFRRVCDIYEEQRLEDCLSSASSTQVFRGRGLSFKLLDSYYISVLSQGLGEHDNVKMEEPDEPEEQKYSTSVQPPPYITPAKIPLVHELRKFVSQPLREPTEPLVHTTHVPYSGARRRRHPVVRPMRPPTCSICGFKAPDYQLFHLLQMEWERMLSALAAEQLGIVPKRKAVALYNKNELWVCRSHFMGMTTYIRRADFPEDCEAMEDMASKTFSRKFGAMEFREWCTLFMEKFEEPVMDPFHVDAPDPEDALELYESQRNLAVEEKPTDLLL